MSFSQRKGLKPIGKVAQIDNIDSDLRNALWDALTFVYWNSYSGAPSNPSWIRKSNLAGLFQAYWHLFLKLPNDKMPNGFQSCLSEIRNIFFNLPWNEVYDFLEFTLENGPERLKEGFVVFCNKIFERENAAYRFLNFQIVNITSSVEIETIESAIEGTTKLKGLNEHLTLALSHLSNRKDPDFRNSIKESISAVEGICQIVSGKPNATLGDALRALSEKKALHGALIQSLSSLYGYTSDADGIRHAMLDESSLTYNDAKYMLVICTGFINYVIGKAVDLKIEF